jgi:dUTP pyrophosphatase
MIIKFNKLVAQAKAPKRANPTDAGADLFSLEKYTVQPLERKLISTGISMEIPEGYYGRIAPRSGLAVKNGADVLAGVVDSSYRGEIKVVIYNTDKSNTLFVEIGDRVAQIIIEKHYNFEFVEVVEELSETDRGSGGFGSTGS